MVDKLVIDVYYRWFKSKHEDYNDDSILFSTNQDDINKFIEFVKKTMEKEFGKERI